MGARERIHVGAARLERDDRHAGGDALDRLHEAAPVGHALDRECDDFDRRIFGERIQHVCKAHVGRVAEPDAEPDPEPLPGREERERVVHAAALGNDREATRGKARRRPDEARAQLLGRREEPGRVRPENPQPGLRGDRHELGLERLTARAGLGPAARMDDCGAGIGPRGLSQDTRHSLRRHRDEHEVDGIAQVGQPLDPGAPGHALAARIDRDHRPGKRREAVHQGVAGLAGRRGCSHDGHRLGRKQAPEPGAQRCPGRAWPWRLCATSSGSMLAGRRSSKRSRVRTQSLPAIRPTRASASDNGRSSASTQSSRT